MTRIIRDVLLVLILATILIFIGGAVSDWIAGGTGGTRELFVWFAWDAGALLLVIALVWVWRRIRSHQNTNGKG